MPRYDTSLITEARKLRSMGKTYAEIRQSLNRRDIPKSTLSTWCSRVKLPPEYANKIAELNKINTHKGRCVALVINKMKREKLLAEIKSINSPIALDIQNKSTAKIALAMLCLGEATKSNRGATTLSLGNSDPRIILLFLKLLEICFPSFSIEKVRCTVQCRADQSIAELEEFWLKTTKVPKRLFYKAQVDPRTVGKPTKRKDYKGVLRVDYFDNRIWFELESLADLVYNQLSYGPVA